MYLAPKNILPPKLLHQFKLLLLLFEKFAFSLYQMTCSEILQKKIHHYFNLHFPQLLMRLNVF